AYTAKNAIFVRLLRLSIDFLKGGDFRMWNLKNQ
ncbi:unnamed protein product, partial [marine sediment metagenome]